MGQSWENISIFFQVCKRHGERLNMPSHGWENHGEIFLYFLKFGNNMGNILRFLPMAGKIMANISIVSKVGKNMGSIVYFFPKAWKIMVGNFHIFPSLGINWINGHNIFPMLRHIKKAQLFPRTIPYL